MLQSSHSVSEKLDATLDTLCDIKDYHVDITQASTPNVLRSEMCGTQASVELSPVNQERQQCSFVQCMNRLGFGLGRYCREYRPEYK